MAAPRPERSRESLPSLMAAGGAARGSRSSGGEILGEAARGGETLAAAGGCAGLRGERGAAEKNTSYF